MSAKGPSSFTSSLQAGRNRTALMLQAVGRRDYRLPLFMSTTLGGGEIPSPGGAALTDMSAGQVTWQAAASVRHQLITTKRGATIGIVGEAFLPLGPQDRAGLPNNPVVAGRAIRFGVTFGF
ncbi:MAG: hypothetical protein AB7Q29_00360 [Vicinamibacterales bacterium]